MIVKPDRLFTFGCSFTQYNWATWANILAFDLECNFYNFGRCGAGNLYIYNTICQASNYYKFTKNDLIIVCWSNIFRNDNYSYNSWETPGQDNSVIEKIAADDTSVNFYALRDYSLIQGAWHLLDANTNFHFISMNSLTRDQHFDAIFEPTEKVNNIFESYLKELKPSFSEILWGNNIMRKKDQVESLFKCFFDVHPLPLEHLEYIHRVFDYKFKKTTIDKVTKLQDELINYLDMQKKDYNIYNDDSMHSWSTLYTGNEISNNLII